MLQGEPVPCGTGSLPRVVAEMQPARPHWVRRYVRFCGLRVREFHRIREHGQELAGLARVVVLRVRYRRIDDGQSVSGVERGVAGRVYLWWRCDVWGG